MSQNCANHVLKLITTMVALRSTNCADSAVRVQLLDDLRRVDVLLLEVGDLLVGLRDPLLGFWTLKLSKHRLRLLRLLHLHWRGKLRVLHGLGDNAPMLGLTQLSNYLTSKGSFSAVSKPNFANTIRKYALESSRRDLQNALLCTVLVGSVL